LGNLRENPIAKGGNRHSPAVQRPSTKGVRELPTSLNFSQVGLITPPLDRTNIDDCFNFVLFCRSYLIDSMLYGLPPKAGCPSTFIHCRST
jgi:hypothetical protein